VCPGDRRDGQEAAVARATASGSTTLGMLVEMLVERAFLVSGVVKTVLSQSPLFPTETLRRDGQEAVCVCVCVCVCVYARTGGGGGWAAGTA
jgi:hypothetical protein